MARSYTGKAAADRLNAHFAAKGGKGQPRRRHVSPQAARRKGGLLGRLKHLALVGILSTLMIPANMALEGTEAQAKTVDPAHQQVAPLQMDIAKAEHQPSAMDLFVGLLPSPSATEPLPEVVASVPVPEGMSESEQYYAMEGLLHRKKHTEFRARLAGGWQTSYPGSGDVTTLAHRAASIGDVMALRILKAEGQPVDSVGPLKRTPIYQAFTSGKRDAVAWLLANGNNMDRFDALGQTPLIAAWELKGMDAVKLARDLGFEINPANEKGVHLIDLMENQDDRAQMKQWGAKSPMDDVIAQYGFDLPKLAQIMGARLQTPYQLGGNLRVTDFDHIHALPQLAASATRRDVTLVVSEYASRSPGPDHIKKTSRVADATMDRLRGDDNNRPRLLALHEDLNYPGNSASSPFMRLMLKDPGIRDGTVIFSRSMGRDFHNEESFRRSHNVDGRWNTKFQERDFWNDLAPVLYNSVGNDHGIGDRFLDAEDLLLGPRTVLVGGAAWNESRGKWQIEYYSENDPLFVTQMPEHHGRNYSGTSFNAPGGAAIHASLQNRYPSLNPEEIMFAMAMTASRNVHYEGADSSFYTNGSGFAYAHRAGFGVVQTREADAVAASLVRLKAETGSAELMNIQFDLKDAREQRSDTAGQTTGPDETRYYYTFTAPEDMVLSNIVLDIYQEKGAERGGASLLFNDKIKLVKMKYSSESQARADSVMGEVVRKGETITLMTSGKLGEGAHIRFRGLRADSAIGLVASNPRADKSKARTVTPREIDQITRDLKARKALQFGGAGM